MAWPAWRSPSWRVVGCSSGSGSALHSGACRCRGQQPRAAPPLSPSAWLSAAALAVVSSDTTAHASCFGAGLLRITLCSANARRWSRSSCVLTEGDHMCWNTMSSVACCVIYTVEKSYTVEGPTLYLEFTILVGGIISTVEPTGSS